MVMMMMMMMIIIIITMIIMIIITVLWNQRVQNDITIPNNKPDIIIRDNEKRTCMLIDVTTSGDRNEIKKDAEKIVKYKDLTVEIQRMWNVKTKVIPVIIRTTSK